MHFHKIKNKQKQKTLLEVSQKKKNILISYFEFLFLF